MQRHNVIDNREVTLREELLKVLPRCKAANFALGYFFLSGYRAIHEAVSKVPRIRLLISGNVTGETVDAIVAGYKALDTARVELDKRRILNPEARRSKVEEGKREVRESIELLDPDASSENTVRGLADLIRQGRLDVRIYIKGTLHAKCYLFHYEDPIQEIGSGIVGSSNLSISGLVHNSELNLKTNHPGDFAKLCEWFEERWDEAEPFKEEFLNLLDKSWAGTYAYTPRDVYYKALYERVRDRFEYDESLEGALPHEFPDLFDFQKLSLLQAVQRVRKLNGVIIGDVVGLGKTYIGAALMRTLEREGYRPLVICPPHLVDMWETFCGRYEVNAHVLSHGLLRQPDFDLLAEIKYRDRDLVLIDESHNFRHEDTLQYEKLYRYMQAQNRAAILVTATPLSNSPDDVYHQIRLFTDGDNTRIQIPAPNLKAFFQKVEKGEADLQDLLTHVMIRRTRKFVLEHYGAEDARGRRCLLLQGSFYYFPGRDLNTVTYDVDKTYGGHYDEIVDLLSRKHLTLARYGLYNYLKPRARDKAAYAALQRVGPQLLGLIRKILLKRMESSVDAFRVTIGNLLEVFKLFRAALNKGIVPAGEDQQKLLYDVAREGGATETELDRLLDQLAGMNTGYWAGDFDLPRLQADLKKDTDTFEAIHRLVLKLSHTHDDKLAHLEELVTKVPKDKKILIFTEYADTARYLDRYLRTKRVKALVHGDIHESRAIERVVRRFSPAYNPPGLPAGETELDLVVSTDILAEGMNLQAAGVVVNYDLHWNPTRLIQRIGRVDRLAKEPMVVDVRNFLPATEIEKHLNLEERLSARIKEIHRVIGEDNKILHPDERLNENAMYAIYQKLQKLDLQEGDESFGLDQVEQELRRLMKSDPVYWDSLLEMPSGIRAAAPTGRGRPWAGLVTCAAGSVQEHYLIRPGKEPQTLDWQAAYRLLQESREEDAQPRPEEGNALVAAVLQKFTASLTAVGAQRDRGQTLPPEQRWATEQIARALKLAKDKERKELLQQLFEGYHRRIGLQVALKDLRRLRRSETDAKGAPERILERLIQIYKSYDLGSKVAGSFQVPASDIPRVLYARFLPLDVAERVLKEAASR